MAKPGLVPRRTTRGFTDLQDPVLALQSPIKARGVQPPKLNGRPGGGPDSFEGDPSTTGSAIIGATTPRNGPVAGGGTTGATKAASGLAGSADATSGPVGSPDTGLVPKPTAKPAVLTPKDWYNMTGDEILATIQDDPLSADAFKTWLDTFTGSDTGKALGFTGDKYTGTDAVNNYLDTLGAGTGGSLSTKDWADAVMQSGGPKGFISGFTDVIEPPQVTQQDINDVFELVGGGLTIDPARTKQLWKLPQLTYDAIQVNSLFSNFATAAAAPGQGEGTIFENSIKLFSSYLDIFGPEATTATKAGGISTLHSLLFDERGLPKPYQQQPITVNVTEDGKSVQRPAIAKQFSVPIEPTETDIFGQPTSSSKWLAVDRASGNLITTDGQLVAPSQENLQALYKAGKLIPLEAVGMAQRTEADLWTKLQNYIIQAEGLAVTAPATTDSTTTLSDYAAIARDVGGDLRAFYSQAVFTQLAEAFEAGKTVYNAESNFVTTQFQEAGADRRKQAEVLLRIFENASDVDKVNAQLDLSAKTTGARIGADVYDSILKAQTSEDVARIGAGGGIIEAGIRAGASAYAANKGFEGTALTAYTNYESTRFTGLVNILLEKLRQDGIISENEKDRELKRILAENKNALDLAIATGHDTTSIKVAGMRIAADYALKRLDLEYNKTLFAMQNGFRFGDFEAAAQAKERANALEERRVRVTETTNLLDFLRIIADSPEVIARLRNAHLPTIAGVDLNELLPATGGPPTLPTLTDFTKLTPQEQSQMLTDLAAKTGQSREYILQLIQANKPGGARGRIARG